jgi:hypothetical protein
MPSNVDFPSQIIKSTKQHDSTQFPVQTFPLPWCGRAGHVRNCTPPTLSARHTTCVPTRDLPLDIASRQTIPGAQAKFGEQVNGPEFSKLVFKFKLAIGLHRTQVHA